MKIINLRLTKDYVIDSVNDNSESSENGSHHPFNLIAQYKLVL